jgi:hypothetical protein
MSVFIFGSCVTRDAFELVPNHIKVTGYIARSSFASSFALKKFPLTIDELDPSNDILSPWQRKMVEIDIAKLAPSIINRAAPKTNILVIDFIDERFHLAIAEDAYATVSVAFRNANQSNRFKYIQSLEHNHFQLWEEGFIKFLDLAESLSLAVIVNAVRLSGKSRLMQLIADSTFLPLEAYLFKMYEYAEKTGRCIVLFNSLEPYLDEYHKWGVAPFHYEKSYYEPLIAYIEKSHSKTIF